ncbi:centrosomal protein of 85 kDa [Bombina bombina]|uniref:centrosomal protein of 85 kDa n=1 Tax=Bombina bombina TaxID=8345 RepID=UPI00235B2410|nr:centrosomal protein of 85 kDa [Bombina bombina]
MATVDRYEDLWFQRSGKTDSGLQQISSSMHTEWQTPQVSGKSLSRFNRVPGLTQGGDLTTGIRCPENTDDFCNASGSTSFQPIRSKVAIPTAHVMPSTLGTTPVNTRERLVASICGEAAHPFHLASDPSSADESRKFETPTIEPTLNQSELLDTFCVDPQSRGPSADIRSVTDPYKSLPESRAGTGGCDIRRPGFPSSTLPHSHGWRPEPYSLQPGAELSAWRQQQAENMRLRMEQLQMMNACPQPSMYSGFHQDPKQWDRALMEKEMLVDRQRQHISQLEQKVRESEVQVHNVLLSQASPYGDMCMVRLQELQREVTFLRAQFADKTDSSSREKTELERKLSACEAEARSLKEAMKEAAQKHAEEIKKQEERVKGRDKHINVLKKKCQKEAEQNKEKQQRIETLERYLADLPTVQDHQKQTQELKDLQEKSSLLQEQVKELEKKLAETRAACREREAQLETEKHKGKELMSTVHSLQEELESSKKVDIGERERTLTQKVEDLQLEVHNLQKERECLRKVAESQKKKLEQMCIRVKELEEQISQEESAGQALKEETQRKENALQQLKAAVKELAIQNQDLMERNVTLQEQLRPAEAQEKSTDLEAENLFALFRELNLCMQDLRAICTLLSQRANGGDPNLSLLLGIHSATVTGGQDETMDLPSISVQLNGVRQLKKDIEDLRTSISDRYAQDMGDNCITQ